MKIWWVIASEYSEGGWHWGIFFRRPSHGKSWGGPEWIRSSLSHTHIRRMRKGDLVIAYQAKEGVAGLAQLASDGYQTRTAGPHDLFDLSSTVMLPLRQVIPLVAIKALPHATSTFEFLRVLRGTVFRVEVKGFQRLVGLLLAYNPEQVRLLSAFLSHSGAPSPFRITQSRRR